MQKRIIAISLLFILFAPVATIFLYLQYEKTVVRREVKWKMIAGLDQEELVLLKFSIEQTETELRWEHSKEFEYKGQMYDIVSKVIIGDSIFYRCWWDHEETALNQKLKILVAKASDLDKNKHDAHLNLHVYLFSFFYTEILDWQFIPSQKVLVVYQDFIHAKHFTSLRISPPTPPPKLS